MTFNIGDLCTCSYGGKERGILYRVTVINAVPGRTVLDISPAFGVLFDLTGRCKRTSVPAEHCRLVTLVDLGVQHMKLVEFIKAEVEWRSHVGEPQATPPTRRRVRRPRSEK